MVDTSQQVVALRGEGNESMQGDRFGSGTGLHQYVTETPDDWFAKRWEDVFRRDRYTCQRCNLQVTEGDGRELRVYRRSSGAFDSACLETVCGECHRTLQAGRVDGGGRARYVVLSAMGGLVLIGVLASPAVEAVPFAIAMLGWALLSVAVSRLI